MNIDADLEVGNKRGYPLVSGYRTSFCKDPDCGPHLLLLDRNDKVFCELILSIDQVSQLERRTLDKKS